MSADPTRSCPRCGKLETVQAWPASVFIGYVAGCRTCYDDDVENWRVAGAVPVVMAPTQRLAIEKWNAAPRTPRHDPAG